MSLSSLIVQRQVASVREVEEALARQVIYGGDLVTNLLEVASVDERVLGALLAESTGVQAAPAGELPHPAERARALVSTQVAVKYAIAPLAVDGDTLVVAVGERLPLGVERELGASLGVGIEQRVAPAVRVKQAIARIYGVAIERRMQRLVAKLGGAPLASGSMPPPLGQSPDVMEPPRLPSAPPVRGGGAAKSFVQRAAPSSIRPPRRRRGPLTRDVATKEAEDAADRDTLLDLFFDFSRQFFDYTALFVVHGDIAEGRDAFGCGASRERAAGIGVPLDLPSLVSSARDERVAVCAKPAADGLDAVLLADMQRPPAAEMAVVPLVVRTRAVALLVGDCGEAGIDRESLREVAELSEAVGRAFERIIVRRKLEGFVGGGKETAGHVEAAARVSSKRPPASRAGSREEPSVIVDTQSDIGVPPERSATSRRPPT